MRLAWMIAALLLIPPATGRAADPGRDAAGRIPDARFALGGPVGDMLGAVTHNWLLPAPAANPAILAMFRDRDRPPYRDLLPWSGEFAGKYLTGGTEVLRLTGEPELKRHLARFVAEFIACQDADGYLGPFPQGHRLTGTAPNVDGKMGGTWDAWGHYHALLGLLRYSELTGDQAALAAATRIGDLLGDRFLGDRRPRLVDTGSTEMNLAPAHGLLLLHRRTGTARYRDLAGQLIAEFAATDPQGQPLAGDYLRRGLAGEPFYKTPKPRWESLHPLMALPEWHRATGDPAHRAAFESIWWSIAELDRHNNGGFSSGEQAQGNPYHPGAIETCCTVAWLATGVELLGLTADPVVADELELATLNSALGWFAPNGRWCTYNTPMDGVRKATIHDIGFQCRPGSPELSCCSVNAARGLGLVGDWAVRRDPAGLFLNWYGPGTIDAPLDGGNRVKLTQETDYPAGNQVILRVDPAQTPGLQPPPPDPALVAPDDGPAQRRTPQGHRPRPLSVPRPRVAPRRPGRPGVRLRPPVLGRRARLRRQGLDLPRPAPPGLRPPLQPRRRPRSSRPRRRRPDPQPGRLPAEPRAGPARPRRGLDAHRPAHPPLRLRPRRRRRLGLPDLARRCPRRPHAVPPSRPRPDRSGRGGRAAWSERGALIDGRDRLEASRPARRTCNPAAMSSPRCRPSTGGDSRCLERGLMRHLRCVAWRNTRPRLTSGQNRPTFRVVEFRTRRISESGRSWKDKSDGLELIEAIASSSSPAVPIFSSFEGREAADDPPG